MEEFPIFSIFTTVLPMAASLAGGPSVSTHVTTDECSTARSNATKASNPSSKPMALMAGAMLSSGKSVNRFMWDPSRSIMEICHRPASLEENTISGDWAKT